MKFTIEVFDGELFPNEPVTIPVDLSDFKSGVLWVSSGSSGGFSASLQAIEPGGFGPAGVASASAAPQGRAVVPALPDTGYQVRIVTSNSPSVEAKVIFVGDDGKGDDDGFSVTLTGTIEKE